LRQILTYALENHDELCASINLPLRVMLSNKALARTRSVIARRILHGRSQLPLQKKIFFFFYFYLELDPFIKIFEHYIAKMLHIIIEQKGLIISKYPLHFLTICRARVKCYKFISVM
jgi:hypothetical protein